MQHTIFNPPSETSALYKPQGYLWQTIKMHKNMSWSLFTFRGHSTREPASVVCDDEQSNVFILRAHTGTCISRNKQEKIRRGFGQKWRWVDPEVEISKEEIPGSKRSMQGYNLTTPGFKGRTV